MQRNNPGPVIAIDRDGGARRRGHCSWLSPAAPPTRAIPLALCAPLLIVTSGTDGTEAAWANNARRRRCPMVVVLAGASMMRRQWAIVGSRGSVSSPSPIRMLFYDPFLDPACQGCYHGGVTMWASPDLAGRALGAGITLALVAITWELIRGRRAIVGIGICLVALAADPRGQAALIGCLLYVTGWWTVGLWSMWRRRRALQQLVALHEHGHGLTGVLRRTMSDPALVVGFPTVDGFSSST